MWFEPNARQFEVSYWLAALMLMGTGCQRQSSAESVPDPVRSPAPASVRVRSSEPQVSLSGGTWTVGIVNRKAPASGIALLRAIRAARHDGLDRVVLEFEGALPGYHVEYIDRPVRKCGSGDTTELEGDGWLAIRLEPAAAHDEQGHPSLAAREQRLGLPNVRELELTCDFEAQVELVLGVASPNRYRIAELSSPSRLVVDIRQRR